MKTYRGRRDNNNVGHVTVTDNDSKVSHRLDPLVSQAVWNHSPDGFNWGRYRSGAAQLALALLLDHGLSAEDAVRLHQSFKGEVVAGLSDYFTLTGDQIETAVKSLRESEPESHPDSQSAVA